MLTSNKLSAKDAMSSVAVVIAPKARLQTFSTGRKIYQWKCSLQNEIGLVLSKMNFKV